MTTDKLFPLLYHAHHSAYLEDLPFWLDLATSQGGPILELGCGSGRVTLPLAAADQRVFGLDHDAGMLALLQSRLPSKLSPQVYLLQADVARFPLALCFQLIVMPCNTFSMFSKEKQLEVLKQVHGHLALDGLFAVGLPNPSLMRRMPRLAEPEIEEIFPHPLDGEPVQVSSSWERTSDSLVVTWHYDHLLPDGSVDRLTSQVCHRLASVQDYVDMFLSAGLQVSHMYGDFIRSEYSPMAEHLIILARVATF